MENKLKTPRGEFEITYVFDTKEEAKRQGYGFYFSHEGKDIYTKSDVESWHTDFALVIPKK